MPQEFLANEVKCLRFYNADELARGLSPLDRPAAAIKAGRRLLTEIRDSIRHKETFALESTLSGKTHIRIFEGALSEGHEIELNYLWLAKPEQARRRVRLGGHDVPVLDIRRRFNRSRIHLIDDYLRLATRWAIWDSRGFPAKRLASSATDDVDSVRELIES
ncbi:hypothetical protein BH18VER1_BH18VER1_10980 [soil metagenome]